MRRSLGLVAPAAVSALATVVACSSDPALSLEGADASLPEASVSADGEVPADAGFDAPADSGPARPPFDPMDVPVTCGTAPCAVELVAGDHHFCALLHDGTTRCWGDNEKGALGLGDAGAPVLGDVKQLAAGGATTCALTGDGGVQCWGANDHGQLGLGGETPTVDEAPHPTPQPVALTASATRVDVGQIGACARLTSGDLWCWGDNSQAQLGRAELSSALLPARAEIGTLTVSRMAMGSYSVVALTNDGELASWGALTGPEGALGGRQASVPRDPLAVKLGLGTVTSLAASSTMMLPAAYPKPARGIAHACAVVKGELFCWGDSLLGALGVGLAGPRDVPARAFMTNATAWAQQVATGGDITCARFSDGTVECAGDNAFGALGRDPVQSYTLVFKPVPALRAAVRVAVAAHTVCALLEDGRVLCWGNNEHGELGQGTIDDGPHPEPIEVKLP